MGRTFEPAEPADQDLIRLLTSRDGEATVVILRDGRHLSVSNIAWGYDEADAHAHVTTNISPSIEGQSVDVFTTAEVDRVEDEAGKALYRRATQ